MGGLSKEQQFRSRHDLPQVVNSTNISLLGSHSNRRHENLHSEATPSNFGDGNLTTSFFPNFESNISDKRPHHKIDISYEIIFPSVWPKSNLPSPTEIRPSQPVIESVMVCLEVGRNPMTSPLALAGRLKIMAWWSTSTQEFEFYTWQIHKNRKYQTNLIDSQVQ